MSETPDKAVAIGASAGAVEALLTILPSLPAGFVLPILVVVHLPPGRSSILTELFKARCKLDVHEAEDKIPLRAGTIYFAPPDYHLLVETDRSLSLSDDEPVLFSRPSIDVMLESAADAFGPNLIAIVLTGANQDGARGLRAAAEAGGQAIVQDPEEAFASTMPKAALAVTPSARILSLADIAIYLQNMGKR